MRKKLRYLVAGVLIGGILICPALAVSSFPDVDESADYAEAVEYLKDVGIMRGDDKGNFNPNQTVTRAEMATIICNMLGETEGLSVSDTFSDVPATHWANKYITKAFELGFVSGYGNGQFGPNDTVTYEQAITMIIRAGGLESYASDAGGYPDGYISVANDKGLSGSFNAHIGDVMVRWQIADIVFSTFVQ